MEFGAVKPVWLVLGLSEVKPGVARFSFVISVFRLLTGAGFSGVEKDCDESLVVVLSERLGGVSEDLFGVESFERSAEG